MNNKDMAWRLIPQGEKRLMMFLNMEYFATAEDQEEANEIMMEVSNKKEMKNEN